MLNLLDQTLEAFLRTEVPLSPKQIDISFEAPDSEWSARVSRPTVNLFLWDVRENVEERTGGLELVEREDGTRYRRPPKPRVDCRYLVTAWTSEVRDEHQLLGDVLATLLGHRVIDARHLRGAYESVRPLPLISVARPDERDQSDFWSALGGQLKPGLDLVVAATVDLALQAEAGAPVERYLIELADNANPSRSSHTESVAGRAKGVPIGTAVRSRRGSALVDALGQFLVRAQEGDEVTLEDDPQRGGRVGARGPVNLPRSKQDAAQLKGRTKKG